MSLADIMGETGILAQDMEELVEIEVVDEDLGIEIAEAEIDTEIVMIAGITETAEEITEAIEGDLP